MQAPLLLPNHLTHYTSSANTDDELLQLLLPKLDDLVLFFEFACEDEKWMDRHSKFLRFLLRWVTKQYYLGNLSIYYAQRIVKVVQDHHVLLHPFLFFRAALFFTIKLKVENDEILVNSLLFGVCSPILRGVFKRECFEKLIDEWRLLNVSKHVFHQIEMYILKGEIPELWRVDYADILSLMDQAKVWELKELVKDCAAVLRRYIDPHNVVETILKAHQKGYEEWKEEAYTFFNQQGWGFRFLAGNPSDLKIAFLDFKSETLELFFLFAPWVTHLTFGAGLSREPEFQRILPLSPGLIGVDLSGSDAYVDQFASLPSYLVELALSACFWLRPDHLRQIASQCPHLKKLELAHNTHLTPLTWGELHRFRHLRSLNLARCFQLTSQDLKSIGQGCSLISDLNLEECRGVDHKGLLDLMIISPHLHELNLSYCNQFSDSILIEVALHLNQLTHLQLVNCTGFTDNGLQQLIKLRPTLKFLNVKGCHFSFNVLESIRKIFPLLELQT
jgi:hypothetical protein